MNNSILFGGASRKSRTTRRDTGRSIASQKLSPRPGDDMNSDMFMSHPAEPGPSQSNRWDSRDAAPFLEDVSQSASTVIKDTPALPEDFNDRQFIFSQNAPPNNIPLPVRFMARAPSGQMHGFADLNQLITEQLSRSSSGVGLETSNLSHSPGGFSDTSFFSRTSSTSSSFTPISANNDSTSHLSSSQPGHVYNQQTQPEYEGRFMHLSSQSQYQDSEMVYNPPHFPPPVQNYTGQYVASYQPEGSVRISHSSYPSGRQRTPQRPNSFHQNRANSSTTAPSVVRLGSPSNLTMRSYSHHTSSISEHEGSQESSPSSSTSSLPSIGRESNSSQVSLDEFVGSFPSPKVELTKTDFFCKLCNKSCGRRSDVYRHLKSGCKVAESMFKLHEYSCPNCKMSFKRRDALNRHIDKKACGKRRKRKSRLSPPPDDDKGKMPTRRS